MNRDSDNVTNGGSITTAKQSKPKIILIDLQRSSLLPLQQQGLNVVAGTLGRPFFVHKATGFFPLELGFSLPNYAEQEIVVIDLSSSPLTELEAPSITNSDPPQWWARTEHGQIDPRPVAMKEFNKQSERIFASGGIFIAFMSPRELVDFGFGCRSGSRMDATFEPFDTWGILPVPWTINVTPDEGREVKSVSPNPELRSLLNDWLDRIKFNCTVSPTGYDAHEWDPVLENKYGGIVGTLRVDGNTGGIVLLLPQLEDKGEFLSRLFKEVLPILALRLFPDYEGSKWIHKAEYEPSEVIKLRIEKGQVEEIFKGKLLAIDQRIIQAESDFSWMSDLLTEYDDKLVSSVKRALGLFGFSSIVDMDQERDAKGALRREDLQIRDGSPLLIVDVKGIKGNPSDQECQQAHKHQTLVMRAEDRTDVRALTIINHQRIIPPLQRDNGMPFRQEILEYAAEMEMGLMTTWDIWRLIRSFQRNSWRPEHVKPIFYRVGRIHPIPAHYQEAGNIVKVWKQKSTFGIVLALANLKVGDMISFEFPTEFTEHTILSLAVDNKSVENAKKDEETGIQLEGDLPQLRENMRVFKVG